MVGTKIYLYMPNTHHQIKCILEIIMAYLIINSIENISLYYVCNISKTLGVNIFAWVPTGTAY